MLKLCPDKSQNKVFKDKQTWGHWHTHDVFGDIIDILVSCEESNHNFPLQREDELIKLLSALSHVRIITDPTVLCPWSVRKSNKYSILKEIDKAV